jgi:hypothetical protein
MHQQVCPRVRGRGRPSLTTQGAAHMETSRRRSAPRPLVSELPPPQPAKRAEQGVSHGAAAYERRGDDRFDMDTRKRGVSLYPKGLCGGHLCAVDPRFDSPYLDMNYSDVRKKVVTFPASGAIARAQATFPTAGLPAPAPAPVPAPAPAPTLAPVAALLPVPPLTKAERDRVLREMNRAVLELAKKTWRENSA